MRHALLSEVLIQSSSSQSHPVEAVIVGRFQVSQWAPLLLAHRISVEGVTVLLQVYFVCDGCHERRGGSSVADYSGVVRSESCRMFVVSRIVAPFEFIYCNGSNGDGRESFTQFPGESIGIRMFLHASRLLQPAHKLSLAAL